MLDALRINGQLYALPAQLQPAMIFYHADYFAQRGLTPPATDWTFEDFIALASSATTGASADRVYGYVPFQGNDFAFLLAAYGIEAYDLNSNPPALRLDDPDIVNAYDQIASLIASDVMPEFELPGTRSLNGNRDVREQLVVSGHAAMWGDLAGLYGGFVSGDLPFKIGLAALPRVRGLLPPANLYGFFISRRAADPSSCWEWIKFLSAQPGAFSAAPARRSVNTSAAWDSIVGADTAAALRAAIERPTRNATLQTEIASYPIDGWLADAFNAALKGADAATELARAQQYAEDYVACMAQSNVRDQNQITTCAKSADPGYKTITHAGLRLIHRKDKTREFVCLIWKH
jgi:ABC-type glycerol-3-phosphate transport system substrate-binding protein